MADTITITDNRTGEQVEVPIVNGGVDAKAWSKLLPGVWFFDPSFGADRSRGERHHRARRRGRASCATGATPSSSSPRSRATSRSPTC